MPERKRFFPVDPFPYLDFEEEAGNHENLPGRPLCTSHRGDYHKTKINERDETYEEGCHKNKINERDDTLLHGEALCQGKVRTKAL